MTTNWLEIKTAEPFRDIAIFSADFWGHSYWHFENGVLTFNLHFVDDYFLPERLCLVDPSEAAELRALIEKYGYEKENYKAVWDWAAQRVN